MVRVGDPWYQQQVYNYWRILSMICIMLYSEKNLLGNHHIPIDGNTIIISQNSSDYPANNFNLKFLSLSLVPVGIIHQRLLTQIPSTTVLNQLMDHGIILSWPYSIHMTFKTINTLLVGTNSATAVGLQQHLNHRCDSNEGKEIRVVTLVFSVSLQEDVKHWLFKLWYWWFWILQ